MKWPRGRAETDNSDACGGNPERLTRPTLLRPRRSHSGEFVARQNDLPVPVLSSQQEDIVFEGFFQDAVARRRPNSPHVSDGLGRPTCCGRGPSAVRTGPRTVRFATGRRPNSPGISRARRRAHELPRGTVRVPRRTANRPGSQRVASKIHRAFSDHVGAATCCGRGPSAVRGSQFSRLFKMFC